MYEFFLKWTWKKAWYWLKYCLKKAIKAQKTMQPKILKWTFREQQTSYANKWHSLSRDVIADIKIIKRFDWMLKRQLDET